MWFYFPSNEITAKIIITNCPSGWCVVQTIAFGALDFFRSSGMIWCGICNGNGSECWPGTIEENRKIFIEVILDPVIAAFKYLFHEITIQGLNLT